MTPVFKYFLFLLIILNFSRAYSTDQNTLEIEGELTDSKIPLLKQCTRIFLTTPYPSEKTSYKKYFDDDALIVSPETMNENVRTLYLHSARLLDRHIENIGLFKNLKRLELPIGDITDQGVIYISTLTQLEKLNLSKNKITDEGIKTIAAMPKLRSLDLSFNKVTDKGIDQLKDRRNLNTLIIKFTRGISPAKYKEIEKEWSHIKTIKYSSHSDFKY